MDWIAIHIFMDYKNGLGKIWIEFIGSNPQNNNNNNL